jgi:polyisoprenoid-binding protein YceI
MVLLNILTQSIISLTLAGVLQYNVDNGESRMKILGDSNVHEWEEYVKEVGGNASIRANSKEDFVIESLSFKAKVKSIESTKGSIMDNKTYDALEADDHPYITFTLDKVIKSTPVDQGVWLNTKGWLTVAGIKQYINLDVKAIFSGPEKIRFEGSKSFKMSDFGIDPPTAMMGSMKVKDEITIKFNVVYTN